MRRDGRLLLARGGLAAAALEGLARAQRYAEPRTLQVVAPVTALRSAPEPLAEQADQLLFGELFDVLETANGFAFGQARRDGYVGHVALDTLSSEVYAPTHWVSAVRTFAHAEPTIRSAAARPLSLNALVEIGAVSGGFALATAAGWLPARHLSPIGEARADLAAVAEAMADEPYLWGGRDSLGLDCSGLVQQALYACGRCCPRDADQQQALGIETDPGDLRRGDLVFWRGHVGIMLDAERLIHANAHHMAVAIEPLASARARIRQGGGGEPTAFRRL